MQPILKTFVLRHKRENLKKCSLRGLESREDFQFFKYPFESLPDLSHYIVLSVDAPPLTRDDADKGIFLIDSTWRYAKTIESVMEKKMVIEKRSLPGDYRTAYPRKQDDCSDPERGLASIEALYIAYRLLGRDPTGLLINYHWEEEFLKKNEHLF